MEVKPTSAPTHHYLLRAAEMPPQLRDTVVERGLRVLVAHGLRIVLDDVCDAYTEEDAHILADNAARISHKVAGAIDYSEPTATITLSPIGWRIVRDALALTVVDEPMLKLLDPLNDDVRDALRALLAELEGDN